MEYIKNELLGEGYYSIDHPSGLKIFVYPKEDYASTYAVFSTKYGSIDTCFKRSDREDFTEIPEGTAHFLEHKLFESEELDAFQRYAKTGASANAFTSFDKTCYEFNCTGHFKENFEILIDFVRHPYFTEETVRKEQGIIGQEIDMYRDNADWESFFNLLKAMYHYHPVRIDIAGTKQSISEITADTLFKCYDTFYNLSNMALAVAGNVTVEDVLEVADRLLEKSEPVTVERVFKEEPETIVQPYIEEKQPIVTPVFAFGYKDVLSEPNVSLERELGMTVLLDIIAGQTSELYSSLLDDGLINGAFGTEYMCGYGYAAPIFSGESTDINRVVSAIKDRIAQLKKDGVTAEDFETVRRKRYGKTVRAFTNIETIANGVVTGYFENQGLFAEFEVLQNMTLESINELLASSFDESRAVLSVINPKE